MRFDNHYPLAVPRIRLNTYGNRAFQTPAPWSGTFSWVL